MVVLLAGYSPNELIGYFALEAATEAGPHAAAARAVLVVGGEAHDLAQVALSLAVDGSG